MKYARRIDANQPAIFKALVKAGYKVRDYSFLGHGVPDLCVFIQPGYCLWLEIKDPAKPASSRKLTDHEEEWMQWNSWNTRVILTAEEAFSAITAFKQELACMLKNTA